MFESKRDHGNVYSRFQECSNDRSQERSRERSKDRSRERSRERSKDRFWERSGLSRLQFLIACSMQNGEGGRMSHVREGRCEGAVPDKES